MRAAKCMWEEITDHLAAISANIRNLETKLVAFGRLKLRLLVWIEVRLSPALLHIHTI